MTSQNQVLTIPLGAEGLTGQRNIADVRPTQLIQAFNVGYDRGPVQKIGGAAKYNSTAITGTPKILSGHDWHPVEGTQRMVVMTDDGKVLRDTGDGSFGVTLKTGLSQSKKTGVFIDGGQETIGNNKKLFLFTGENVVQVVSGDGVTMADITLPPADWTGAGQPVTGVVHEGRLWGALSHRLYASDPDDHEDFSGSGALQFPLFPGVGDEIKALTSFKGALVVWKRPRGIYLLDTSSPTTGNWRSFPISEVIGIAGPRAFAAIDDDVAFIGTGGEIHLISAVDLFGNLGTRSLSSQLELDDVVTTEFSAPSAGFPMGVYYSAKRILMFALPGPGATQNTRIWTLDFNGRTAIRSAIIDRDIPVSLWLRRDINGVERPVNGDDVGFIRDLDQDSKSKDGAGYQSTFQTPHMDFSQIEPILGTIRKNGQFLELVAEPQGDWDVNVDVLWDGDLEETLTFNMGTSGGAIGSFILGTDKLGGQEVLNRRRRMSGSGRRLSLIFRNSGDGQDFSLSRAYVHFTPGSDQL